MNKKILLADDDSDDAEIFREAVGDIDPAVICVTVSDGSEVLENLANVGPNLPDLIFLDINMPDVNGWECLKRLKSDENYNHIPVIIYSTSSNSRDRQMATDLGASYFFTKPEKVQELNSFLTVVLNNLSGDLSAALALRQV